MGRIIIALVVALGLGLSFPTSRAVIAEHSRPLLHPAYRWMTAQELNRIIDDLEFHQESRGPLPTARGEFDAWMAQRYPQERSREDAWGTPYRLQVTGERFVVVSAGPDREFGTPDDLAREGTRTQRRR